MVVRAVFHSLLAVLLLLVACKQSDVESKWISIKTRIRDEFPSVRHMAIADLRSLLEQKGGAQPVLLDVRDAREFAVSHLQGAQRAVDLNAALAVLKDVDKDSLVVAYCSVGYRSSRLAQELGARGYSNVFNLEGSIFEWANRGHAVYRGADPAKGVHPYDEEWGRLLTREMRQYEAEGR